jgi:glycosyltransferase involved in cell wall biosynthesis
VASGNGALDETLALTGLRGSAARRASRKALRTYDLLIADSSFTQRWITKRWRRTSEVVYPPVEPFARGRKLNRILHVGRFCPLLHNKRQLEMVRAFRELCNAGLSGWELHLAGSLGPVARDQDYFRRCIAEGNGLPVFFHSNCHIEDLRALYASASIYWHATGLGESVEAHPERFEHFGISVVEAMSAGCVPIVLGEAGPAETVRDGVDGFHWHTPEGLVRRTLEVVQQPAKREAMAREAQERSAAFDSARFSCSVRDFVTRLGAEQSKALPATP